MLVGEDLKKGRWKEEDGVAGHCDRESIVWCASRASLWHWSPVGAGRVSGLLFWLVWDFLFFSHFPSLFLGEVSPRSGSQAGASETTSCLCHQLSLALSVLPYWLNRWRTFEWQAPFCSPSHLPQTQHTEESSIFIPSPPFLCFESFICKLGDKTYGANLQQINSDPGWLSTPDIQWELLDAQHLSVFEALPYSLPKCVGKECQQRHSRPIICILPTRWHYQRKLILCNTPRLS